MNLTKTLGRQLGVALAAAGLITLTLSAADAQRGGNFDLVNAKPATTKLAFGCRIDDGYGRFSSCDQGGG